MRPQLAQLAATTVSGLAVQRRALRDALCRQAGAAVVPGTYSVDFWIGDEIPVGAAVLRTVRAGVQAGSPLDNLDQVLELAARLDQPEDRAVVLFMCCEVDLSGRRVVRAAPPPGPSR